MKFISTQLNCTYGAAIAVVFTFFGFTLFAQSSSSKLKQDSVYTLIERSKTLLNVDEKKAVIMAEKAVSLAETANSDGVLAEAEYNLGLLYIKLSENSNAIPHFERSIKAYAEVDSTGKRLMASRKLGRSYYAIGDYPKAMTEYMKALSEYERLDIKDSELAWLLRYIGSVFSREQNYVKAMEYYVEAFKVFNELEDVDGMATCYNTIGNVYIRIEDLDLALENYLNSLEMSKKAGNLQRASIVNDNIGQTYRTKGDYKKALKYYTESYNYLIDSTSHILDYSFLSGNQAGFGDLFRLQKKYKIALTYYNVAEKYALRSEKKRALRLQEVYEGKYKTYEALNNDERALHYFKLYTSYTDSIQGNDVVNSINEIEINYRSEKGKLLIDELNAEKDQLFVEKENEKENVRNAWFWIVWLIVAVIGISLFSTVVFIQKRKIEAANTSLVGQNLEAVKSEQKIKQLETETVKKSPPKVSESEDSQSSKYSNSALLDEQKEELLDRLNKLMEEDEAYKMKDLTVVGVAKILKTNKSYISQVINEYLGMNFSSYVNEYRVKEARRLLSDKKYHHLKIESIAGDSGFNSVSAFNNAYKKFTGLTPSYYLKSVIDRDENA